MDLQFEIWDRRRDSCGGNFGSAGALRIIKFIARQASKVPHRHHLYISITPLTSLHTLKHSTGAVKFPQSLQVMFELRSRVHRLMHVRSSECLRTRHNTSIQAKMVHSKVRYCSLELPTSRHRTICASLREGTKPGSRVTFSWKPSALLGSGSSHALLFLSTEMGACINITAQFGRVLRGCSCLSRLVEVRSSRLY